MNNLSKSSTINKSEGGNFHDEKTVLSRLLTFDVGLGIIPVTAAINSHNKKTTFDIWKFLIQIRQNKILAEIFLGPSQNKRKINLKNINKPESLLFTEAIRSKMLPKDYIEQIFRPIQDGGHIKSYVSNPNERGSYQINKQIKKSNREIVIENFNNALDLPKPPQNILRVIDRKLLDDKSDILFKRMCLTTQFYEYMNKKDIISEFYSSYPHTNDSFSLKNISNIPLVGVIKGIPDLSVLYIMSYYKNGHDVPLSHVDVEISRTLKDFCKKDPVMNSLLNKTACLEPEKSDYCYGVNLLARPTYASCTFGVHLLFFSKKILDYRYDKNHPLKQLYDYVNKLGWGAYFQRHNYYKFSLEE